MKNHFKKWILVNGIVLSTFFLSSSVISCSTNNKVISIKGSTSMWSFLNGISSYLYDKNKYLLDIESLGSSSGIDNLLHKKATFAALSKNPISENSSLSIENQKKWKEQKIKTIPVAEEKMTFLLKVREEDKNKNFYFGKDNWEKILNAFGGEYQLTLNDFLKENEQVPKEYNYEITPFYRSGGYGASGKAETFVKDNPYKNIKANDKAAKFLSNTIGNPSFPVQTLDESDTRALPDYINFQTSKGKIALFSFGFLINNTNFWQNDNYVLVKQNIDNQLIKPEEVNYGWKRFFYLSFSLKENLNKNIQFIYDFLNPSARKENNLFNVYKNNSLLIPNQEILMNVLNLKADNQEEWDFLLKNPNNLEPDYK